MSDEESNYLKEAVNLRIGFDKHSVSSFEDATLNNGRKLFCQKSKSIGYHHDGYKNPIIKGVNVMSATKDTLFYHIQSSIKQITSMRVENLQSYLNWFIYLRRVKKYDEVWPKNAQILRHLLLDDSKFTRKY